jgi:hypothetical protein
MRTTVTKQQADWYEHAVKAAGRTPANATRSANTSERERLLDQAQYAGVINSGTRATYARAYDTDPEGTKLFLGKIGLKATGVQTGPPGDHTETAGEPANHGMDAFLTDAERARVAAVREGKQAHIVDGGL